MWPCAVQQTFWLQFECVKVKQIRIFTCTLSKYSLMAFRLAFFRLNNVNILHDFSNIQALH